MARWLTQLASTVTYETRTPPKKSIYRLIGGPLNGQMTDTEAVRIEFPTTEGGLFWDMNYGMPPDKYPGILFARLIYVLRKDATGPYYAYEDTLKPKVEGKIAHCYKNEEPTGADMVALRMTWMTQSTNTD